MSTAQSDIEQALWEEKILEGGIFDPEWEESSAPKAVDESSQRREVVSANQANLEEWRVLWGQLTADIKRGDASAAEDMEMQKQVERFDVLLVKKGCVQEVMGSTDIQSLAYQKMRMRNKTLSHGDREAGLVYMVRVYNVDVTTGRPV